MPWSVKYVSELDIIRSVYTGQVTADDFKEGTRSRPFPFQDKLKVKASENNEQYSLLCFLLI